MSVRRILEQYGALYAGEHFVFSSGRHASTYVDIRPLYPLTNVIYPIAKKLVEILWTPSLHVTDYSVVVGPDFGGNVLAEQVAASRIALDRSPLTKVVRTEKCKPGGFMIPRLGTTNSISRTPTW